MAVFHGAFERYLAGDLTRKGHVGDVVLGRLWNPIFQEFD
jgi:hypothetical protein